MNKNILTFVLAFLATIALAQQKQQFLETSFKKRSKASNKNKKEFSLRSSVTAKGNMTFIANNILSVNSRSDFNQSDQQNGFLNMVYVDIDNDPSTFSSSMARLNLPSPQCAKVLFAGLYWAGIYPYETWSWRQPRKTDAIGEIKLKLPGDVNYRTIKDAVKVFDEGEEFEKPYLYFKDVTDLVGGLGNPNGDYYVANVRATLGNDPNGTGSSAGWTLVVVYENDEETNKKFYVFDGFSTISKGANSQVEVPVSGFQTIPQGPVKAELLVGALEGDRGISGDQFLIRSPNGNTYHSINESNSRDYYTYSGWRWYMTNDYYYMDISNYYNNFFDGSISKDHKYFSDRVPKSKNTLGFDIDMFKLDNTNNQILRNNQTNTTLKFTTSGDIYFPFLLGMSVEVVEPRVRVIKNFVDGAETPISDTSVDLGEEVWVKLQYKNVGTDNATNTIIEDYIHDNTVIDTESIIAPFGVTRRLSNDGKKIFFSIPDYLVRTDAAEGYIKYKVRVSPRCEDFKDACSNKIGSSARVFYDGEESGVNDNILGDSSILGVNNCNYDIEGVSTIWVNLNDCVQILDLCASASGEVELDAGEGYDSYEWKNLSGQIVSNQRIYKTSKAGTYTVYKEAPDTCKDPNNINNSITNKFIVKDRGATLENPLKGFVDATYVCPDNGEELSEIYLCGNNDSKKINLPFTLTSDAEIHWYELVEGSCPNPINEKCPNVNTQCNWTEIGSDFEKDFSKSGKYKLRVTICKREYNFYFNVYNASLDASIKNDCNESITVTVPNPTKYEFRLKNITTNSYVGEYQDSPIFPITTSGDYLVEVRAKNIATNSCVYETEPLNIVKQKAELEIVHKDIIECVGQAGKITAKVNNGFGEYVYKLIHQGNEIENSGAINQTDYTFSTNISAGKYTVAVASAKCNFNYSEEVTINEAPELILDAIKIKNISCEDGASSGVIKLIASGGSLIGSETYKFAVWRKDGNEIQIPVYFSGDSYEVKVGEEGVYEFLVLDSNNCKAYSKPITIQKDDPLEFDVKETDVSCEGDTDGEIEVTSKNILLNTKLEYRLEGSNDWQTDSSFENLKAGDYTIEIKATYTNDGKDFECIYSKTATVKSKNIVSTAVLTQQLTCENKGIITFTKATGGNAPYEYGINGVFDGKLSKENLQEGTYVLSVRDSQGCEKVIDTIKIELPRLSLVYETNNSCSGLGKIEITDPLGADYRYKLINVNSNQEKIQSHNVFDNLEEADYKVQVISGNCFSDQSDIISIKEEEELKGKISYQDSKCYGANNGSITVQVTSGSDNDKFEYSLDNKLTWLKATDNPYQILGLAPGDYKVHIRKNETAKDCAISFDEISISQPEKIIVTTEEINPITCALDSKAVVKATATGGTPPYSYSIDGKNWNDDGVFKDVPQGEYSVYIRDKNGCDECGCSSDPFVNGGFEEPGSFTGLKFINENDVSGWNAVKIGDENTGYGGLNTIEIWHKDYEDQKESFEGDYFAELNSSHESTLYQSFCTQEGDEVHWSLAHRGREGRDAAKVRLGSSLSNLNAGTILETDNNAWKQYQGTYVVPKGQSVTVIAFQAVSTASGNKTIGNFIDDVKVHITNKNCSRNTIEVAAPQKVAFDVEVTKCYGGNNGFIEIKNTQGTPDFTYTISKGGQLVQKKETNADNVRFESLLPGTYEVEVVDKLGCAEVSTQVINETLVLESADKQYINCNDQTIEVSAKGGAGNYVYAFKKKGEVVTASDFKTENIYMVPYAVVTPQIYEVYVRDNNGDASYCEDQQTIEVIATENPQVTITKVQPKCFNDKGSITVTISKGKPPYTIVFDGKEETLTAGNEKIFTDLEAKNYLIKVKDANDCFSKEYNESIDNPKKVTVEVVKADATCDNSKLGNITFKLPLGDNATYEYGVNGDYKTDKSYDLPAGNYVLTVKNSEGCIYDVDNVDIQPLSIIPSIELSDVTYSCEGNGALSVEAPNGLGYTYSIDGSTPSSTTVFDNLIPGEHTIKVYADNGACPIETTIVIDPDQEFKAHLINQQTTTSCVGDSNGGATIVAENFGTSYEYIIEGKTNWTKVTDKEVKIDDLPAGTYTIKVRVSEGQCERDLGELTIKNPEPVTVKATVNLQVDCASPTKGSITAEAQGGTGDYEYQLLTIEKGIKKEVKPWQSDEVFNGLDASDDAYIVIARDSNGCLSNEFTLSVEPRIDLNFTLETTGCFMGVANREITVKVTQGKPKSYSINGGDKKNPNGIDDNNHTFGNLSSGKHLVKVEDIYGCILEKEITILEEITFEVTKQDINCKDGFITLSSVAGGDGNYKYAMIPEGKSLEDTDFQNDTTTSITSSGKYLIYVRDGRGCESKSKTVEINKTLPITITSDKVNPTCHGYDNGNITLNIAGGKAPYTVTSSDSSVTFVHKDDITKQAFGLKEGKYTFTVVDVYGCEKTHEVALNGLPELTANIAHEKPTCGTPFVGNESLFKIIFKDYPTISLPNKLQFRILNEDGSIVEQDWQDDPIFEGVSLGGQVIPQIRIIDDNGEELCREQFDIYTMPYEVSPLVVNTSIENGDCSMQADVEVSKGVGPFEYSYNTIPQPKDWEPSGGTNDRNYTFDNLVSGRKYYFYVKDLGDGNCVKYDEEYFAKIDVVITPELLEESCFSADTGALKFTINDQKNILKGGTSGITWKLFKKNMTDGSEIEIENGSQNNLDPILPTSNGSLAPGTYLIEVYDTAKTCIYASTDIRINKGLEITGDIIKNIGNITCSTSGVISFNVTGGAGMYEYELNSDNLLGSPVTINESTFEIPYQSVIDPTKEVKISVSVKDKTNCLKDLGEVVLQVSPSPKIDNVVVESCDGLGTLTVNVSGGSGTYTYKLLKSGVEVEAPTPNNTFSNVEAGTYTVSVTDTNGCTVTYPGDIIIHPALKISNPSIVKELDCTSAPEAIIKFSVLVGSGDYRYEVKGNSNGFSESGNISGNIEQTVKVPSSDAYIVTVYDNNNTVSCPPKEASIQVLPESKPVFTATATNNNICNGSAEGVIQISNANASLNPITYEISPKEGTFVGDVFTGLPVGSYTITATGSNGCTFTHKEIDIEENSILNIDNAITINQFGCQQNNTTNNATITVDFSKVTGGTNNYVKAIVKNVKTNQVVFESDSSFEYTLTDTNGGNFAVEVYDSSNCYVSKELLINPFLQLAGINVEKVKSVDCKTGEDIKVSYTPINLQTTTIELSVTGINGTNYTKVSKGLSKDVVSEVFNDLPLGEYEVEVLNKETGCKLTENYKVERDLSYEIVIENVQQVPCLDPSSRGSFTFKVIGGITSYKGNYKVELYDSTGYKKGPLQKIDNGDGEITIEDLVADTYSLKVIMEDGPYCEVVKEVEVKQPDMKLAITHATEAPMCVGADNGKITFEATGGWGGYTYQLMKGAVEIQAARSGNSFHNLGAGDYTLHVQDSKGCTASQDVKIQDPIPVTITSIVKDDDFCDTKGGGEITVLADGGTGTYSYTLFKDGVEVKYLNDGTNVFSALSTGDYTVLVKDDNNCSATLSEKIALLPALEAEVFIDKLIDCTTTPEEGIIKISATLGSGSYKYEVKKGNTGVIYDTGDFKDAQGKYQDEYVKVFEPDTYVVLVYDEGAGCLPKEFSLDIAPKITPVFSAKSLKILCKGATDGEILITKNKDSEVSYAIQPNTGTVTDLGGTLLYSNLSGGSYTIVATGKNDCTYEQIVEVEEYKELDLSKAMDKTLFTCKTNNQTNYAAIIVDKSKITGGSGNYVKVDFADVVSGEVLQSTSAFNYTVYDETGGDYLVTVYDDQGCSSSLEVKIDPLVKLNITPTVEVVNEITCTSGQEIKVTYEATNIDVTQIEYTIMNIDGSYTETNSLGEFKNLQEGTYQVYATNTTTQCTSPSEEIIISKPKFEVKVNKLKDVACLGSATGEISFEFISDTHSYNESYVYEVFNVDGTTTNKKGVVNQGVGEVEGLTKGEYYVVLTMNDAPSCEVTSKTITIEEPEKELALVSVIEIKNCSEEVTMLAEGGWGDYEFMLENTDSGVTHQSFDRNDHFTGLVPGKYKATVRDMGGCMTSTTFELITHKDISSNTPEVTDNSCTGDSNAAIKITNVMGGMFAPNETPEYQYTLIQNGVESQPQNIAEFTGLRAGDYTVKIYDNYYCKNKSYDVSIKDPVKVEAMVEMLAPVTCNRDKQTVKVIGNGGTGVYEYSTNGVDFDSNNLFSLLPGEYEFYVRDSNGCTSPVLKSVKVNSFVALKLDGIHKTNITCRDDSNGTIEVAVSGGFGNYSYELLDATGNTIQGVQKTNFFDGLEAGVYSVKIYSTSTDDEVCQIETEQVTIEQPESLTLEVSELIHVRCLNNGTGEIIVAAKGGNGDYQYNISPGFDEKKYVKSNEFKNLLAGDYIITVRDGVGCDTSIEVTVKEPTEIVQSAVEVTQQTCITDPSPVIKLTMEGGAPEGEIVKYTISINGVDLKGIYEEGVITLGASEGIEAGMEYHIGFRTNDDCDPTTVVVKTDTVIDLQPEVVVNYICPTGNTIVAKVQELYENEVVYSLLEDGVLITSNVTGEFANVDPGNKYSVSVVHAFVSCPVTLIVPEIHNYEELTVEVDDSQKNKLIINTTGGLPPYEYSVDGNDFDIDNEIIVYETKDYVINVRDARGCEVSLTVSGEYISIDIPTLFTPDGDGVNDKWYPINVEDYHELELEIRDRYGRKLKNYRGKQAMVSYPNSTKRAVGNNKRRARGIKILDKYSQEGWDGTYEGRKMPSGDYWYIIKYKELSGQPKQMIGHFTLYR